VVKDGRFATSRDNVSLVTSGGPRTVTDRAYGRCCTIRVIAGESQNNVDRWGPCPANAGTNFGCVDGFR